MDVVGTIGYSGQPILFVSPERFAFISGNGLCIIDCHLGPREILWKSEKGINKAELHEGTNCLAFASRVDGDPVEVIHYSNQGLMAILPNPSSGKIIDMSFSRDGKRLLAISDATDHKVFAWDLATQKVLFVVSLSSAVRSCLINPADSSMISLSGDNGLIVGFVGEIMGEFSVRLEPFHVDPEVAAGDGVDEEINQEVVALALSNSICFCCWAPSNRIFIGNCQGFILEVDVMGKSVKTVARIPQNPMIKSIVIPTCAVLSTEHLIVGSSDGMVYWYSTERIAHILSKSSSENEENAETLLASQIVKLHRNGNNISQLNCLVTDPSYTDLVAGSACGPIYHMAVEVQELPKNEADEELDVERSRSQEVNTTVEISLEPSYDMHEGAVLCTKPLALPVSQLRGSPPSKGNEQVSLYVTASHVGIVTFWRPTAFDMETSAAGAATTAMGVRKSVPRVLRVLARCKVGQTGVPSNQLPQTAATVIEKFSLACKGGGRILGVGTADGWIEVWQVRAFLVEEEEDGGDEEDGGILKLEVTKIVRRHVFRTPVTIISSHDTKPCVAIGSAKDDRIYIMSTTRAAKFQIVSYVSIGNSVHQPILCLWSGILLWVGCHNGKMFTFQPHTEKSFENPNPEEAVAARVAWDTMYSTIGSGFLTSAGGLVTFSPDSLKLSVLPSLPSMMELEQANLLHGEAAQVPVLELPGTLQDSEEHADLVICCTRSPSGTLAATGTADGSVYIWRIRRTEISLMNRLDLHGAPVLALCFNAESSQLMSCSADGSVFLTSVEKGIALRNDPAASSAMLDEEELKKLAINEERAAGSANNDKLWVEQKQAEAMESLYDEYRGKSSELKATVQDLCARLGVLLQRNDAAAELEKMHRSEFVVDLKGKDALLAQIDAQEKEIRQAYEIHNLRNELISARIRCFCWDTMEQHSRRILPLQADHGGKIYLSSYAVKKVSEREQRILSRVCRLRAIEIQTQRFRGGGTVNRLPNGAWRVAWTTAVHGCPPTTSWIVNDGLHWPCADTVEMLLQKEKQEAEGPKDKKDGGAAAHVEAAANTTEEDDDASTGSLELNEQEVDDTNVFNLLYPPVAIRTQIQKRNQIILLQEVIRRIKMKFNEHFEKLYKEKEDVVASIESRNARIRDILDELMINEAYSRPQWDDVEIPGSAIVVADSEVVSRPYETEAARQIRLKEEEERRQRAADKDREDSRALALEEMMHGSLEVKRDVFAEVSALKKPQWMLDMRYEDMDELQRKEVDDFEAKLKALQEEQLKYRKSLELELKRLRGEVVDISKVFDEKLVTMSRLRMLTHREVLSQELYMTRLACTMVKREHSWAALKSTTQSIEDTRKARNDLRGKITRFTAQVEEEKLALQTVQEEERTLDRTFKRDLQTLCNTTFDQESLKVFTQLFRQRQYAEEDPSLDHEDGGFDATNNEEGPRKGSKNNSSGGGKKKRGSYGGRSSVGNKGGSGHQSMHNSMRKSKLKHSSGLGMGSKQSSGMGPMQEAAHALKHTEEEVQNLRDPFFLTMAQLEKARKIADSQIPLLTPLSLEADCPEGFSVDQFTWSKLQELRTARIQKEIEAKRHSLNYAEMRRKLEELTGQEDALVQQIDSLKVTREGIQARLRALESDLEIVVALKQGQDEVDQEAAVTDYGDAILVPTEVVTKYNGRIYELGKEKTGVLSRIRQFRRKINLVDWEAQHLKLQTNHLEEYFTDLQLLRITRELQEVIRSGGTEGDTTKVRRMCHDQN